MPVKIYKLDYDNGSNPHRAGHVFKVHGADFALYKVHGGYRCDHPRSGQAIIELDYLNKRQPYTLREAEAYLRGEGAAFILANLETINASETLNDEFD